VFVGPSGFDPKTGAVTVSGNVVLAGFTTTAAVTGAASIVISPGSSGITDSWLYGFASLFRKYRMRKLVFHVVPDASTAIQGTFKINFTNDPADFDAGAAAVVYDNLDNKQGTVISSAWMPSVLDATGDLADPWLYVLHTSDESDRTEYCGRIQYAWLTITAMTFRIIMEFECEFLEPRLTFAIPSLARSELLEEEEKTDDSDLHIVDLPGRPVKLQRKFSAMGASRP
jgi:hypothetical protein